MAKSKEDFDLLWRFKAIEVAAMELLELEGILDSKKLFKRARDLYHLGYDNRIDTWRTVIEKGKPVEEKKKVVDNENHNQVEETVKIKDVISKATGLKVCPKCGEQINPAWSMHRYKQDGSLCGAKW